MCFNSTDHPKLTSFVSQIVLLGGIPLVLDITRDYQRAPMRFRSVEPRVRDREHNAEHRNRPHWGHLWQQQPRSCALAQRAAIPNPHKAQNRPQLSIHLAIGRC